SSKRFFPQCCASSKKAQPVSAENTLRLPGPRQITLDGKRLGNIIFGNRTHEKVGFTAHLQPDNYMSEKIN
ncbi:MAG TPA: hypothetical protein PKI71_16465, partial [Candidatus Rifleibacterium sp.]|nr:hypothetical protein [Candidatus Rifleibacterium sp.]